MREAILGRLRQAPYVGGADAMAALALGGPELAYAADPHEAYAAAMPVKAPLVRNEQSEYAYWAAAFGAWGHIDGDDNAAEAKRKLGGFVSGIDRRFGHWRLGLAGGYTSAHDNVDARLSSASIASYHIAGYAGAEYGAINLRSGIDFAWHDIDTNRTAAFPGFADQLAASYNGSTAQSFGEIGYGLSFGHLALEPFAGLA